MVLLVPIAGSGFVNENVSPVPDVEVQLEPMNDLLMKTSAEKTEPVKGRDK